MILDDEEIAESSGNVAVVGEAGTSIVSSSAQLGPVRRSVHAGKLNNFIDHVIHCLASYVFFRNMKWACVGFIFKCVLISFLDTFFSVVLIFSLGRSFLLAILTKTSLLHRWGYYG